MSPSPLPKGGSRGVLRRRRGSTVGRPPPNPPFAKGGGRAGRTPPKIRDGQKSSNPAIIVLDSGANPQISKMGGMGNVLRVVAGIATERVGTRGRLRAGNCDDGSLPEIRSGCA